MFLFKSKAEKELAFIESELKQFLQNNYKDQAHACRKMLMEQAQAYYRAGKLSHSRYRHYEQVYQHYTKLMQDYRH